MSKPSTAPFAKPRLMASTPTPFLLSLGSNLEPRVARLHHAIDLLTSTLGPVQSSHLYETSPVGYTDQPDFLNCCIAGQTDLSAEDLYAACKNVERSIGRLNRERWREREIDVDVILYGSTQVQNDVITIPHPRMQDRRFVLAPAAEIVPHMIDPRSGRSINELLQCCTDAGIVRILL